MHPSKMTRNFLLFSFVITTLLYSACTAKHQVKITPPVAKIVPKTNQYPAGTLTDNYFWLRDKNNPDVLAYLQAENQYTDAMMKHTVKLQDKLYREMLGRIKETDLSVPEKIDDYFYYSRTEAGKQYRIDCRKHETLDAPEEILLDENQFAAGHNYFDLGSFEVSTDHKLVAFSTDYNGSEVYMMQIKDLSSGAVLPERIQNTSGNVQWANDNKTLFYTTLDAAKRPDKLYRHTLGADPAQDPLLYEEKDQSFYVYVYKSRSEAYLFLDSSSLTTSEISYLSTDHPNGAFEMIEPRKKDILYSIDHRLNRFYILTNEDAKNFKLMETSVTDPTRENWTELIPARQNVMIENMDAFENHLVVYERENGLERIRIRNLSDEKEHFVDFPEAAYAIYPTGNSEFNKTTLRFNYQSLVTPPSVYDYDMDQKTRQLKKQYEVLGGFDPNLYKTERIFATGPDGAKIPISLLYKKSVILNGKNPVFLTGYGAYGYSNDPYFSSKRFSLVDRGFVFALAHIRGGGELGRTWYESGKLFNKRNTFTDFIACAEHLVTQNYTSIGNIAISGASAGGLLIGAVVNMRPDLFKVVIAQVPYVDVINTMMDPSIPLTVTEYEEWGDPRQKQFYDYMISYSPYDNVRAQAYPAMLITTSLNDPRVAYWEPAKLTAKLRAMKTDQNVLLLKTNMEAGHSGSSGRYDELKDDAFQYAFILDQFGIVS
jgi:oligopeptidase B